MKTTAGADDVIGGWLVAQTIAGRLGLGVGEAAGADGVGVGLVPAIGPWRFGRLSGLATTSTPTRRIAITAAAAAAIQFGPADLDAPLRDDRARSRSAGLGETLIWSTTCVRSRRKAAR